MTDICLLSEEEKSNKANIANLTNYTKKFALFAHWRNSRSAFALNLRKIFVPFSFDLRYLSECIYIVPRERKELHDRI
jgi:hypothetical protein